MNDLTFELNGRTGGHYHTVTLPSFPLPLQLIDISDEDDEEDEELDPSQEFDNAFPQHSLLDSSAGKDKAKAARALHSQSAALRGNNIISVKKTVNEQVSYSIMIFYFFQFKQVMLAITHIYIGTFMPISVPIYMANFYMESYACNLNTNAF